MQPLPTVLVIGEILFDVFPTYTRMGGAPFNFAYHLSQCGFPVHFISRIGDDAYGHEILDTLESRGFNTTYIQRDARYPTGTVQVHLDDKGIPEFNIVADVAYDRIDFDPDVHQALLDQTRLIYFGTLVQRSPHGFDSLQHFFDRRQPNTIRFYDINLRPNCFSKSVLATSLDHCDVLKLNVDELRVYKEMFALNPSETDEDVRRHLMDTFGIGTLALTDGEHGSTVYANGQSHPSSPQTVLNLVDTVGAGDGFAAMMAAGLLLDWPLELIHSRAAEFAARICSIKGAIPESADFYDIYRNDLFQGAPNGA
jgi:fructokinase